MTSLCVQYKRSIDNAKRVWAEQPVITSMAGIALVIVIAQTALSDVPEPFDGAAKIGKLFYDLALGYFAAWLFNVLVIVIPRQHDQARILQAVSGYIRGISGGAQSALQAMARDANLTVSESATRQEVNRLCAATDPNGTAPMLLFSNGQPGSVTWLAYLQIDADRFERFHELLVPAYPYFDAKLIALLRQAATPSYLKQIRLISTMPVRNTNLTWLASALYDYSEACRRIDEYFKSQISPLLNSWETRGG